MTIDQSTLAGRLKQARLNANLTQEEVAKELGVPRTAIVQIESGNRAVSTLELAKLSALYGKTIASFFDEDVASEGEEDVLVALFRAAHVEGDHAPWQNEVSQYLNIFRTGVELEHLLGRPAHVGPPSYEMPIPRKVMEAVEQGNMVAEQERRRLGIGSQPIPDMSDLINGQNIWASGASLPDDISGLFLKHSTIGLCILVHFDHPRARKRFSYAHEYAHALLDRKNTATVSLVQNRSDLDEVRANAFAASFLMPRSGVWSFLNSRFKGGPSVVEQAVYDPLAELDSSRVQGKRREPTGSQALTYEDVAALAHHFGVSYQAAVFRLKSLGVVNETQFEELRGKESFGKDYLRMLKLLDDLEGKDLNEPDREIVSQVVHLALEAFRREEISKGRLRDLSSQLNIESKELLTLAEAV